MGDVIDITDKLDRWHVIYEWETESRDHVRISANMNKHMSPTTRVYITNPSSNETLVYHLSLLDMEKFIHAFRTYVDGG